MSGTIADRIYAAEVQSRPCTHFVADQVLDDDVLEQVDRFWPEFELFDAGPSDPDLALDLPATLQLGAPAHLERLTEAQRDFWVGFIAEYQSAILQATFTMYANYFQARFQDALQRVEVGVFMLMETDKPIVSHPIHVHYHHDPTWLFTNLLYIDDGGESGRGTSMYGLRDGGVGDEIEALAKVAAKPRPWTDMPELEVKKSVEFRPNRLFSMMDSPISFHGVGHDKPNGTGRRRIIRSHVSAPTELAEAIYGVAIAQYRRDFRDPVCADTVVDWMRRDIQMLKSCRAMGAVSSNMDYAGRIEFPHFDEFLQPDRTDP